MALTKLKAFTIMETLIVLGLVSFFVALPVLAVKQLEAEMRVQLFLNNFERAVIKLQHIAITTQQSTWIGKRKGQIVAYGSSFENPAYGVKPFGMPPEITSNREDEILLNFLPQSGNLSKLEKIIFHWPERKIKYVYQFHIGSGRYTKNIE